jgi:hypothetical protein
VLTAVPLLKTYALAASNNVVKLAVPPCTSCWLSLTSVVLTAVPPVEINCSASKPCTVVKLAAPPLAMVWLLRVPTVALMAVPPENTNCPLSSLSVVKLTVPQE